MVLEEWQIAFSHVEGGGKEAYIPTRGTNTDEDRVLKNRSIKVKRMETWNVDSSVCPGKWLKGRLLREAGCVPRSALSAVLHWLDWRVVVGGPTRFTAPRNSHSHALKTISLTFWNLKTDALLYIFMCSFVLLLWSVPSQWWGGSKMRYSCEYLQFILIGCSCH